MSPTATAALDAVFETHYARIARVIGRVLHDQARSEELAVEVFVKWWRNPLAHGEHAEGWLYRAAVRLALDELRRRKRRSRFENIFSRLRETPPTPERLYVASAGQQNVREVLSRLRKPHAQILLLRSEGLSYQEIASALQLNPNYVGSLLSRAQQAFRKEYEKRYGKQS